MARAQGTGGSFAMDAEEAMGTLHRMLFELGQVVGDVVEKIDVDVPEDPLEGPPGGLGQQLTVCSSVVRRCRHGRQVMAALR